MGGVHPSFMADEALEHADAVVVGEAELVMPQVLDDLAQGQLRGIYKADRLHSMVDMPMPRYDLVKKTATSIAPSSRPRGAAITAAPSAPSH